MEPGAYPDPEAGPDLTGDPDRYVVPDPDAHPEQNADPDLGYYPDPD